MKGTPSRTLILLFEQYKTPAAPYFSILNRIESDEHLISGFLIEETPSSSFFQHFEEKKMHSRTLFLHFQQYKTQPYLIFAFQID